MDNEKFDDLMGHTMSLEDFLLMRLEMIVEDKVPEGMEDMVAGGFITVMQCVQLVGITLKHDELAEALKKAIEALDEASLESAGFYKQLCLTALNKLEAEKKGEPIDWEYCTRLTPDSSFLEKEMRRVWG